MQEVRIKLEETRHPAFSWRFTTDSGSMVGKVVSGEG